MQPIEKLQILMDTGWEFPDAVWQVTQHFKLSPSQVEDLEEDFEDQDGKMYAS